MVTLAGNVVANKGRHGEQMMFAGRSRMLSSCLLAPGVGMAGQITVPTHGLNWQCLVHETEEIPASGNISEFRRTSFLPRRRSILLGFKEVEESNKLDILEKMIYL